MTKQSETAERPWFDRPVRCKHGIDLSEAFCESCGKLGVANIQESQNTRPDASERAILKLP